MAAKLSQEDKVRKLIEVEFMLLHRHWPPKKAAKEAGVCYHTVLRWIRQKGWKKELTKKDETRRKNGLKYDESLTVFFVSARTHNKPLYEAMKAFRDNVYMKELKNKF